MAEINTVIAEASQDLQTIEDFVNLPAGSVVNPRLLPSVDVGTLAGTRQAIFEAGGLPAEPFATKAEMQTDGASLADGQLAIVYNETANNGLYVKTAGIWKLGTYGNDYRLLNKLADIKDLTYSVLSNTALSSPIAKLVSSQGFKCYLIEVTMPSVIKISKSKSDRFVIGVFNEIPTNNSVGEIVFNDATATEAEVTTTRSTKAIVVGVTATNQSVSMQAKGGVLTSKAVVDLNSRLSSVEKVREIFKPNAELNKNQNFDVKSAIKAVDFWGLADDESVYLRTLYNYFLVSEGYVSSIGFNSSQNYHIAPAISKQLDYNKYASFPVSAPETGVKTYILYKNGDSSNPSLGSVTIDWDVVTTGTTRYINTENTAQLDSGAINDEKLSALSRDLSKQAPSVFSGKKIGAIGDSITWGFRPRNDIDGVTGEQMQSWLVLTANKLGMAYDNRGISGSTLGANSTAANSPMSRRFDILANDCDIVVVMGGTNDVRKSVPLGTIDDRTDSSYYGALHVICEGLINKYQVNQGLEIGKTKHIVLATPIKLLETGSALNQNLQMYAQAVRDVAAFYSLPVLDLNRHSNINPHILQTVQGTESGYIGVYNPYITDGTHPTQQGHEMMASYIAAFLKSIIA